MKLFVEIYGWYGAAAIVVAYALVSFNVVDPSSVVFQSLNATGALGIVLVSLYKSAYQPAALNAVWTFIALVTLVRMALY